MLILFRHNAKKYAYDTVCGALHTTSALEYRMLEAIQPPMGPICPTALRYELAKYDSEDVAECYDSLYEKAANGMIFVPENGTLCVPVADNDTVRAALLTAAEKLSSPVRVKNDTESLAKEILGAKNLIKD
jgi:hypothetical protein